MSLWDEWVDLANKMDVTFTPTPVPKLELAIIYSQDFYGEASLERVIFPCKFTSSINRRACASILSHMTGDEIKAVLRDQNIHVDGCIVEHTVEYLYI